MSNSLKNEWRWAVIIAIGSMALLDYGVGVDTPKLSVPGTIRPTWEGRGWLIHPIGKLRQRHCQE